MTEESDGVSRPGIRLSRNAATGASVRGEDDPVDGTPEQPIRPVRQEITNVDENGRARIVFRTGRTDGDGRPRIVLLEDLQAGLALEAEEKGDGAVVGVCAGADVVG